MLMIQRSNKGRWALPGGEHDAGEFVNDTVVREIREETGIKVEVVDMSGIYTGRTGEHRPDLKLALCDDVRNPLLQRPAVCLLSGPDHSPSPTRSRFRQPLLPQDAEGPERDTARDPVGAHDFGSGREFRHLQIRFDLRSHCINDFQEGPPRADLL
ncbi:NUDIX domain-containing protein [Streptomyces olivoreticuli]